MHQKNKQWIPIYAPKKKTNLLILGASGGVAHAVLQYLVHHRNFFNRLILLDKKDEVVKNPYLDHATLHYTFIHEEINILKKEKTYRNILKKYEISLVLDLTDADSLPLFEATEKCGVSYINTALNDEKKTVSQLVFDVLSRKNKKHNAASIFCAGMNPGNVNMWVRQGIEKFGIPKEIIHFEYDTSHLVREQHPSITWSLHEFLVESTRDPGGKMLGRDKVKMLFPNALENRKNMKFIASPVLRFDQYPEGFQILHEENVSIAQKYDVPSQFLYAIHPQTMKSLLELYAKNKKIIKKDLLLGDNQNRTIEGADCIGVALDYPKKRVYYLNTASNGIVIGTNATYLQVAVGVFSALFTLIFDNLSPGVYFVEDLFNTHYKYYMFDNLRVQEFVFMKDAQNIKDTKEKKLTLASYNPEIKLKRKNRFEHLFI
ncbi:saccharopine dehydrogenase NADP-binding domain-containing protein [Candidatus Woesearchaeota archaeon]|nr:saccharopine dehydrogenase NADP-binding domain-containing protein [Candidatus Woesearchaeota archaeon]